MSEPVSNHDDANTIEASFALLELCLERAANICPVESPSQILELIPQVSDSASRLIVVELIKFDLASAGDKGIARSLDFYWPEIGSELPQDCIPFDLVLEEVQLLKARGGNPNWEDYRQRFPDLADTIGKWLIGGDTQAFSGATTKVPELPIGQVVDDFHVLKQLGQGAFARVYLAQQNSMQRLVALKATSRGSEEPQALSRLDHPNIVRVYDQREISEPPTILLYMQYLAGGTLADCIKHVRDLPAELWSGRKVLEAIDGNLLDAQQTVPEQSTIRQHIERMDWAEVVAWIGIQLAEGLDYANGKGVLHRDVKPANILLSAEAIPKLADFNVSCSGLSGRAGAAAYFGGSLAYMSPEQLQVADPTDPKRAEELDGRSDVYSLGIVLWELWQAKRPWTLPGPVSSWTDAVAMQRELRNSKFRPLRPARTAAERVLEKALRSLLAMDPDSRPASGKEAAARLRLAFYPELASRFEPSKNSFAGRLLRIPVLLLSALLIFGPNTAASRFNYVYNEDRMENEYGKMHSNTDQDSGNLGERQDPPLNPSVDGPVDDAAAERLQGIDRLPANGSAGLHTVPSLDVQVPDTELGMQGKSAIRVYFEKLSFWVNLIVFPLGASLFFWIMWPVHCTLRRADQGRSGSEKEISVLWTIGLRATLICGVLWSVSGGVFAYFMASRFPEFQGHDAFHFFISLVLCGGVAWIYPYFGMTLLSLLVYYPKVIAPTMNDPNFDSRCERIRLHSSLYLLSAAAIPLTAMGALVFRKNLPAELVLGGVCITALGLIVAYVANQKLDVCMQQYSKVLGGRDKRMEV